MRTIFAILGIAAIVLAGFAFKEALKTQQDFKKPRIGGTCLAVAGVAFLIAAGKHYRGHWSFVIGVALLSCGVFGLSSELDDYRAGKAKDLEFGIGLSLGLMASGFLSLWSAHKLHTYAKTVEDQSIQRG